MNIVPLSKTLTLLKRLADTKNPTEPIIDTPPQKPEFKYPVRAYSPKYAVPESAGVPSGIIERYAAELYENKNINIQNLLIQRNGSILFECGFGMQDIRIWKNTFSECKSITSLAIGILIGDGLLTLDTRLTDIFGKKIPVINRLRQKEISIEHLLTMSSQIIFNEAESMATPDWQKGFFNSAVYSEVGEGFNYNSLNSYILSAAVHEISGRNISEFLSERLFSELDITDFFWEKCPMGIEKGGWGLYITPYDMAKLGQLLLWGGRWNDKQLVPEEYVRLATSCRNKVCADIGDYDYGYQIWVGRNADSFLFNGMLGQNMLCYKNNGIIIVSNAGNADTFQQNDFFSLTDKYFSGDFQDSLPPDPRARIRLEKTRKFLSQYHYPRPTHLYDRLFYKKLLRENMEQISKREYKVTSEEGVTVGLAPIVMQAVQNGYTKGTVGFLFGTDGRGLWLDYKEADRTMRINIGFREPCINEVEPMGEKCLLACAGEFCRNEDAVTVLKLTLDFLEFPYSRRIKFFFRGDLLEVRYSEIPGKELLENGSIDIAEMIKDIPVISALAAPGARQVSEKINKLFEPVLYAKAETQ